MVLITSRVGLPDNFQPFHWGLSSALVDNVPLVEVDLHVPKKMWQWRKILTRVYFMQVIYGFILPSYFCWRIQKNRSYYELIFWSTHQQYHLKFFESIRHSLLILNTLHRLRGTAGPSLITCLFVAPETARCGTFVEDFTRKTLEPTDVTCPKVQPMPMKPPSDMRHLWCQWIP